MRLNNLDLKITAAVSILACGSALSNAPVAVTAPLGIALFMAPGYLLVELLFGSRISGIERAAVATGLAIATPMIGGLLMFAAGISLHPGAWYGLLAGVTLLIGTVLFVRRRAGDAAFLDWRRPWERPAPRHVAAVAATIMLATCGVVLARVGVAVQHTTGFTQLWLDTGHEDSRTASLGVTNEQGSTTRYRLVLLRDHNVTATWKLTLANRQTWRRVVPFASTSALSADLYLLSDPRHPYRHVDTPGRRLPSS